MKLFEGFSNKYAMYANLEEKLNVMKEKVRNFFKKKFYQNLNCKKKYNPSFFMLNPNLFEKFLNANSEGI